MSNTQIPPLQLDSEDPGTTSARPRTEVDIRTRTVQAATDAAKIVRTRETPPIDLRFGDVVGLTIGPDRTDHNRLDESIRNRYPTGVTHGGSAAPPPASAVSMVRANPRAVNRTQDRPRQSVPWGAYTSSSRPAGAMTKRAPAANGADVTRIETPSPRVTEAPVGR